MHRAVVFDRETDIHVWRIWTDGIGRFAGIEISSDEIARGNRLVSAAKRNAFIAQRIAIRKVLSLYLPDSALLAGEPFSNGPYGKPSVVGNSIAFNVSHSPDGLLIAVSQGAPVGVDIEKVREPPGFLAIAQDFFSPAEYQALTAIEGHEQVLMFFRIWTRKEALLKAMGVGLSYSLNRVTVLPLSASGELIAQPAFETAARWKITPLDLGPEFIGALATHYHVDIAQQFSIGWPDGDIAQGWQQVDVESLTEQAIH